MSKNIFSGFYKKDLNERFDIIKSWLSLEEEIKLPSLPQEIGNQLIENYIGNYEVPLGVALNVKVNNILYMVPMAIEEPSVIAALSNGGKILGNIKAVTKRKELVGQVILDSNISLNEAQNILDNNYKELMKKARANSVSMVKRGGGPQKMWIELIEESDNSFLTVYVSYDPCDAMGANSINTLLEYLAKDFADIFKGKVLMSILSNYQENNVTEVSVKVKISDLDKDRERSLELAEKIEKASRYADLDPYRAVTHNKGIMNGIDGVLLATGNDWRAVEAGVHAYAARDGKYKSLSQWRIDSTREFLIGSMTIPLQVATVGGTLSTHPIAQWALNLTKVNDSIEFSNLVASVGLIQNFSALRALVGDGIQKGHMAMQTRALALRVGAQVGEVEKVVELLKKEEQINETIAKKLIKELRTDN